MKTAGADNVRLEPRDYDAAAKTKDHHRPDVVYWDQVEGTEFYHDLKIAWRLVVVVPCLGLVVSCLTCLLSITYISFWD